MNIEQAHELLKWISTGLICASLICIAVHLFTKDSKEDLSLKFMWATLILACLAMPFLLGKGALAAKLLPQCPNCTQAVSSAYCPDCGWATIEEPAPVCPGCGAECTTAFCGECGAPMNQEG